MQVDVAGLVVGGGGVRMCQYAENLLVKLTVVEIWRHVPASTETHISAHAAMSVVQPLHASHVRVKSARPARCK